MYELHRLGWHAFQQLCLTVAGEVLGQTVEAFLDSNDGGRDGAFIGTWRPVGTASLTGRFVIQCKFTARQGYTLQPSDVSDEVAKVERLVKGGLCDSYVLMTNAGVSGEQAATLSAMFEAAGVKYVVTFGSTWICQQITESKRLRMLVPRVYGLGDLSQILDERAYSQARAVLASLREDLSKTVVTSTYKKAVDALDQHGFVLIVGEPAAGKTTIASLLAMAAVDQWGASLLKLDTPDTVTEHWNPHERSQFFWLDDAFGVTQYESSLARGWNRILPQIRTMLQQGAKIVMTSRDYIYNSARKDLKESAFPLLQESQVVVDVHDLSEDERSQILYNHMKLGRQPDTFRTEIKPHLPLVAAHPRFVPETARRLGDPMFTGGLTLRPYQLGQFVEKRDDHLQGVLQSLDDSSKAALALIYMRNDSLESPVDLREGEKDALARLGSDLGGCVRALEALNGSLVQYVQVNDESIWRFKHPTIGDAYAALLDRSPELLGIYVLGTAMEKLVGRVTCGEVGIEKALVLPKKLYPSLIQRLREFGESNEYKTPHLSAWGARWALHGFLSRRCSKEFLALYLAKDTNLLADICDPGLLLSAVSEVDVVIRLHRLGLLPEDSRQTFVANVSKYAVDGEDLSALHNEDIHSVFEDGEFESLLLRVKEELPPRLADIRRQREREFRSEDTRAAAHMEPLTESLGALKARFGDDSAMMDIVDQQSDLLDAWIAEHSDEERDEKPARMFEHVQPKNVLHSERSIFDDVDS